MESCPEIDAPCIAEPVLAILLSEGDIAPFSHSVTGLQKQLDILAACCAARGLTVNVKKTKTLVFEHRMSATPAFLHAGDPIEQGFDGIRPQFADQYDSSNDDMRSLMWHKDQEVFLIAL